MVIKKVWIEPGCIVCNLSSGNCPEVFQVPEGSGTAVVKPGADFVKYDAKIREAAEACARTGARFALAVHWGTLHAPFTTWKSDWFDRPLDLFAAHVAHLAPECHVIRLQPGDTWSLPAEDAR